MMAHSTLLGSQLSIRIAAICALAVAPAILNAQYRQGPGREEMQKICSGCHELERSVSLRQDRWLENDDQQNDQPRRPGFRGGVRCDTGLLGGELSRDRPAAFERQYRPRNRLRGTPLVEAFTIGP